MANIWDEFDKTIDTKGLQNDVKEAAENGGNRREVPHGEYEISIAKLELVKSKKGDPMVSCWMKIVEGEFKNSYIFMNQVVTQGFQIHIVNSFLRDLCKFVESDLNIQFECYKQYGELLMDIREAIDGEFEYSVRYGEKKGFNTFEILDVYELED